MSRSHVIIKNARKYGLVLAYSMREEFQMIRRIKIEGGAPKNSKIYGEGGVSKESTNKDRGRSSKEFKNIS